MHHAIPKVICATPEIKKQIICGIFYNKITSLQYDRNHRVGYFNPAGAFYGRNLSGRY